MAASTLVITKVVVGRIKTIDFLLGADSAFGRTGLKDDVVEIEEIREKIETVLEDGQILKEYSPGRTLQGTITLSELDTASHTAIETANNINIVTATGGANSTGVKFAASLDIIKVRLQGMKTVIEFNRSRMGVISSVASAPTAGGTGYTLNDVLTISEGTGGTVTVTAVSTGAVTAISLTTSGTGYAVGVGKATTGGAGTGCTIEITGVSAVPYTITDNA